MIEIPLCVYCAIACQDNDDITLERTFQRIGLASRQLEWEAAAAMNQTQFGGDSSMDIPPSSPIPPLGEDGGEAKSMGRMNSLLPGETIARLHIRRSRQNPRFAELEGVVPMDSAVRISIDVDHPFHTPTHSHTQTRIPRHSLARRPLPWLRSQNQAGEEKKKNAEQ
ncbi:hypothetical protein F4782DRAFT_493399 [Xylaria castorea]|nr:hypothetical protein F4782DRAFT_493399 [Xylaria castorea]